MMAPSKLISRQKRWQLQHPERRRAHDLVNAAVRAGRLVKPSACEQCGVVTRLDGHHPDYSQPKLVEWLCRRCHCRRHRRPITKGPKS